MKKEFTKMKRRHLVAFMVAFVLVGSGTAFGQTVTWAMTAATTNTPSATSGTGWTAYNQSIVLGGTIATDYTNAVAADGSTKVQRTRGSGLTNGALPSSTDFANYVEYKIGAASGYSLSVTGISMDLGGGGSTSNVRADIYWSNDGFVTMNKLNSSLITVQNNSSSPWITTCSYTPSITVPANGFLQVRVYPSLTSSSTSKYLVSSNVKFTFAAAAVCTPPTVCTVNGTTSINSGSNTNITLVSSQSGVQYGLYIGTVLQSGTTQTGDGSSNLVWNVSPTATTTYTVKTISDGTYCPTVMGNAVITVVQSVPVISLTSAAGTDAQTPTVNNAITPVTYSLASGTATTATVAWTGTTDVNTPPTGITVNFTYPTLTISGTPSATGTYGYTATTDGTPAATATGSMNVSIYTIGDYGSVATGTWATLATWKRWDGSGWNTTATVAPTSSNTVWIVGGYTVTVAAAAACNNLHVISGNLLNGNPCNGTNTPLGTIVISGTTVEVETGGIIGNGLTDDSADAISLQFNNSGTTTITGTGGTIDVSKFILYTANATVVVDHDMNVHYHGTSFAGNAFGLYANAAAQTLTINAGKTLTMAKWSSLGNTGTSHSYPTTNFTVNVNGTLTLQAGKPTGNTATWGWAGSGTSGNAYLVCNAGTSNLFTLAIGSTGTVNVPEFYPNGTVSAGTAGTGSVSSITIASGGSLNIGVLADFRNATQTITGSGAFNLSSGAIMRIGNVAGITTSGATGPVQTTTRSFDSGANYQYEGTAAQVTGNGLPATINNLLINNTTGVTLSTPVTANGTLTVNAGSTIKTSGNIFTNNGTATINGSFQIDEGGWATGNNFVYGTAGTLVFNNSSAPYVVSGTPAYWPATSGPVNVTVQNSGGIQLQVPCNVSGTFQTSASVGNTFGNNLTVSGTVQINANGYFSNFSPTYTSTGTLVYNTGGSYSVNNEWLAGTAAGYGIPQNVTVLNGTSVSLSGSRTIPGTLALTSGQISLGANNLTIASTGSITGVSATNYIVTNGAGTLTQTIGAGATATFPVGASATSYDPATLTPTNATDVAVNVGITLPAAASADYSYNAKVWNIIPTAPSSTIVTLTPSAAVTTISGDVIGQYISGNYVNTLATRTVAGYTATFNTFAPFVTGTTDLGTSVSQTKIVGVYFDGQIIHNDAYLQLQVFDALGRMIITSNRNINMGSNSKGIYFVKSSSGTLKIAIIK